MYYLKLMRIPHYIKNGLVLIPIIFSGNLTNINMLLINILCFFVFHFFLLLFILLMISKTLKRIDYIQLRKTDLLLQKKVSVRNALLFSLFLFFISFGIGLFISILQDNLLLLGVIFTYFISNIFYSVLGFKNIPLVDVCILTLGFYLRVLLGAVVCGVEISAWLYLIVIFGAFYLGFGKRRNEFNNEDGTRKVLSSYTFDFLDKSMQGCMILSIVFFALWCMERNYTKSESQFDYLALVPMLMIICFRYNMNIENKSNDGDPVSVIIKDKILIALSVIFIVTIGVFIYI